MTQTGGAHAASQDDRVLDLEGAGSTAYTEDRPNVENQSVGELLGQVTSNLSTLMRQEVALAKAELTAEASKAGKAAGMLAGAGVAAHLAIVFASITLMWALDTFMDLVLAALIVTLLWAIVAAVLGLKGKKDIKSINKPEVTIETLKEDAQWAKTLKS